MSILTYIICFLILITDYNGDIKSSTTQVFPEILDFRDNCGKCTRQSTHFRKYRIISIIQA